MEDGFIITEGNDRLALQYEEGNFHALVWSSEHQRNCECRAIITQADFQHGSERKRWISELRNFSPETGRAVIRIGENVPVGRVSFWAVYSWCEWDLISNRETQWLGRSDTPAPSAGDADPSFASRSGSDGVWVIDCKQPDWDGTLYNALFARRPIRLTSLHSCYEKYMKQLADTLSMEFVADFADNRGEFRPRINDTAFQLVHSEEQTAKVAKLAREIWQEYYVPIIGRRQVDYMVEKFQSGMAITKQLEDGYEYYVATREGQSAGYLAVVPDKTEPKLMISKLYVRKAHRGSGIGKDMLLFVESLAISHGIKTLWLTVNKDNAQSIAWYSRMGFQNTGPIVADIGGGFVMNDYKMEKTVG